MLLNFIKMQNKKSTLNLQLWMDFLSVLYIKLSLSKQAFCDKGFFFLLCNWCVNNSRLGKRKGCEKMEQPLNSGKRFSEILDYEKMLIQVILAPRKLPNTTLISILTIENRAISISLPIYNDLRINEFQIRNRMIISIIISIIIHHNLYILQFRNFQYLLFDSTTLIHNFRINN